MLVIAIAGVSWAAQVTYQYDAAGRLVGVQYDDGAQVTYTLDAAGNRTQVAAAPPIPLGAPSGLKVTSQSAVSVSLTWTPASGGSGQYTYTLFRNGAALPQTLSTNSATDTGLSPTSTYIYTVQAVDSDGATSQISGSLLATTYALPKVLTFAGSPASTSQINLSWSASDPQGPGIGSFKLFRNGSIIQAFAASTTSFTDTGLSTGTSYNYSLSALDSVGDSSNTLTTTVATYSLPVISSFTALSTAPTTMNLTWAASDAGGPGGLTYSVTRESTVLGCTASPCTDSGLTAGAQYPYTLTVTDSAGDRATASISQSTVPTAPASISVTAIGTTTATLNWGSASGVTIGGYSYLLSGQNFWVPIAVTYHSTNLIQLSPGTTYTVQVVATNAGGAGPPATTTFTTLPAVYTDSPVINTGTNGDGSYGYSTSRTGGFGSISPTTTSNGYTYTQFYDAAPVGSGVYSRTIFAVSGFTSDPGQGWLVSASVAGSTETGASAGYNYNATTGVGTWQWSNGPIFPSTIPYTCTIIHY